MFCSHNNVFISHSSANKEIVEQLSSYIEKLRVAPERIFCSSVVSQGIDNGEKLGKAISEAIGKSRVLVFLLSRDFVSSVYCMQELGIGWHLSEQGQAKCFCLVLPDISISEVKGFINSNVVKFTFIDETHKDELSLFAENLCRALHITAPKHSVQANNESVFYSAIKEKIQQLLARKDKLVKQEEERKNKIQQLESVISDKNIEIENFQKTINRLKEGNKDELLLCQKRAIEKCLMYYGFGNGVDPEVYKRIPKGFWFDNIDRYCSILKELNQYPNIYMEMMMATVYAAERIENKAFDHFLRYFDLALSNDNPIYPDVFTNIFAGYHGSAQKLIDMLANKITTVKEGIAKDSYKKTLSFLTEHEENRVQKEKLTQ
jgi:hypothetical protein